MKKFILLIALSVLLYSAPGNAVTGEEDEEAAAAQAPPGYAEAGEEDEEAAAAQAQVKPYSMSGFCKGFCEGPAFGHTVADEEAAAAPVADQSLLPGETEEGKLPYGPAASEWKKAEAVGEREANRCKQAVKTHGDTVRLGPVTMELGALTFDWTVDLEIRHMMHKRGKKIPAPTEVQGVEEVKTFNWTVGLEIVYKRGKRVEEAY